MSLLHNTLINREVAGPFCSRNRPHPMLIAMKVHVSPGALWGPLQGWLCRATHRQQSSERRDWGAESSHEMRFNLHAEVDTQ